MKNLSKEETELRKSSLLLEIAKCQALVKGMDIVSPPPPATSNPEIMNSSASRSQAAKEQGILGAVGTGIQIGAPLPKKARI